MHHVELRIFCDIPESDIEFLEELQANKDLNVIEKYMESQKNYDWVVGRVKAVGK